MKASHKEGIVLFDHFIIESLQQPGPLPVTYADLAEFTLGALRDEKLYNRYPYVVGDGL